MWCETTLTARRVFSRGGQRWSLPLRHGGRSRPPSDAPGQVIVGIIERVFEVSVAHPLRSRGTRGEGKGWRT
jgi:hypothetical protein